MKKPEHYMPSILNNEQEKKMLGWLVTFPGELLAIYIQANTGYVYELWSGTKVIYRFAELCTNCNSTTKPFTW